MTPEARLAYIAGLIDGEGCFAICEQLHPKGSLTFSASMSTGMVDREGIDLIVSCFGGKVHYSDDGVNQPAYRWQLADKARLKEVL